MRSGSGWKAINLRVSSSSAETGESEDSLETTYGGDHLVMGFNARYLLDFLKVAGSSNVRFHFKAKDAPGEFRTGQASDGGPDYNYRYVVMPIRS
jgi:DNA polymerase III subunit beta